MTRVRRANSILIDNMTTSKQNYNFQKIVVITSVILFLIKITAWYLTNSVAILTDALESTVNVTTSFIGLYSLYISAKPKDAGHPYGHGKIEYVSAAIEGTMIVVAGMLIIYEAIKNLGNPQPIGRLDYGIILISSTAIVNYIVGEIAVRKGRKNNSLALVASGKHLQSDTYSTVGIMVGLVLLFLTKQAWLDSAVALVFALLILYTGGKIIWDSLRGIMDEADKELLKKMVSLLQADREENWIDIHNTRIIKYGTTLHIDCHLTIPWYLNVHEAHAEIDKLSMLINNNFGESIDLFVHADGCLDYSCVLCDKQGCALRQKVFQRKVDWTVLNVTENRKHKI